ncbi:INO80 complex subunit E isoform X1 [Grus americana]|uniref:INO80 complex subunit E isoform X1 n=1 Tax=Grus americana TaxID=9117 RepID=UPI00240807CA|nr:INO80 complex subunit E isoform X1 [Grus americana]
MNGAAEPDGGGYKRRYRALKRRLKLLLYEQECFQEELRRAQRKLLKVSRDKSFLLDRLLQYENVDDDSSDSEATASSDNSDGEGPKGGDAPPPKRKRSPPPSPPPATFPLAPPPAPYMMSSPPYSPFPADYLAPEGPPRPQRPRPAPTRRPKGSRRLQLPPSPALSFPPGRVPAGPLPPPLAPPKAPPPVPSTVPRRMLSDAGEGSGDDPLDGDDELVIDIPE